MLYVYHKGPSAAHIFEKTRSVLATEKFRLLTFFTSKAVQYFVKLRKATAPASVFTGVAQCHKQSPFNLSTICVPFVPQPSISYSAHLPLTVMIDVMFIIDTI